MELVAGFSEIGQVAAVALTRRECSKPRLGPMSTLSAGESGPEPVPQSYCPHLQDRSGRAHQSGFLGAALASRVLVARPLE
jgi:hypothetical protein